MPDVHHAFPRIKNVVVFNVVVNGDFLASAEFCFDGGDMVVGADFAGGRGGGVGRRRVVRFQS